MIELFPSILPMRFVTVKGNNYKWMNYILEFIVSSVMNLRLNCYSNSQTALISVPFNESDKLQLRQYYLENSPYRDNYPRLLQIELVVGWFAKRFDSERQYSNCILQCSWYISIKYLLTFQIIILLIKNNLKISILTVCPSGKFFRDCGTACPTTCDNKDQLVSCTLQCIRG